MKVLKFKVWIPSPKLHRAPLNNRSYHCWTHCTEGWIDVQALLLFSFSEHYKKVDILCVLLQKPLSVINGPGVCLWSCVDQIPSLKSLHRFLQPSTHLRVSLRCNRPRFSTAIFIIVVIGKHHTSAYPARFPIGWQDCLSQDFRPFGHFSLAAAPLFFPLLRGGGSEPLCPRSGTFLAKFSTV